VVLRYLMTTARLLPPQRGFEYRIATLRMEYGVALGLALVLAGCAGILRIVYVWEAGSFGDLDPFSTMRIAIPSVTGVGLGLQVVFASLFLSLVKWQARARTSS
jgi:hypothetical protein